MSRNRVACHGCHFLYYQEVPAARAVRRHPADNIGRCFLLTPRRRETVYRSNKRRHVGSGARTIATVDKILRLIWPRVEMARHVPAISSFINVTNVSRIAPNHCSRVQAITNIVERNLPFSLFLLHLHVRLCFYNSRWTEIQTM